MLGKLTVKNFKSIREQTLDLGKLNVFIGGNGAGKSNLLQIFRLLREIVNRDLAAYTATRGGADRLLYFGKKQSQELSLFLQFCDDKISNSYLVKLRGTNDDRFFISEETVHYQKRDKDHASLETNISRNVPESMLRSTTHFTTLPLIQDLEGCRIYHFHDTSEHSAMKGTADLEDNRILRSQAENLPAFLYWMKEKKRDSFDFIQDTIRQIAPFFGGFRLEPSKLNESKIRLEWKEIGGDGYFDAAHLSDGTLRFICLATLLLQPDLPSLILLDEPELGLHPSAIVLLAEMLESAATRTQIILATQSVNLVNQFTPEQVWAVDRKDGQSVFCRLSQASTEGWLDEYALGELWEKNCLGARP